MNDIADISRVEPPDLELLPISYHTEPNKDLEPVGGALFCLKIALPIWFVFGLIIYVLKVM